MGSETDDAPVSGRVDLVKVAAYQGPLLPVGVSAEIELLQRQVRRCEEEEVTLLCCPEAFIGGLADHASRPSEVGMPLVELARALAPLASDRVGVIVGFTELSDQGELYNTAALFWCGEIIGTYRKMYPAIRKSVYSPGRGATVFRIGEASIGILICNDSNHPHVARSLVAEGARVLFIPTNNALPPALAEVTAAARKVDRVTARENNVWVVRADVAGESNGLISYGSSAITDPSGVVVCAGGRLSEDLLIADVSVQIGHGVTGIVDNGTHIT